MRWKVGFVFLLAFIGHQFVLVSEAFAQTRYFLPALTAGGDSDLGLALTNPTNADVRVQLTAHDYQGAVIGGLQVTNPAELQIPAFGQKALRASEIFGAGITGKSGWIELDTPSPNIKGFYLFFNATLTYMDGGELLSKPAQQLVFQRIIVGTDYSSTVSFVNTTSAWLKLFLEVRKGPFTALGVSFELAPYSGFSGTIPEFWNALVYGPQLYLRSGGGYTALSPPFEGFGVLSFDHGSAPTDSLAGLIVYANTSDKAVLNSAGEKSASGFVPHFVTGAGFTSALGLIKTAVSEQQVIKITADGLTQSGQAIPSKSVYRVLGSNQNLRENIADMFDLPSTVLTTGFIHWQVITTGSSGLTGYLEYGTTDGILLSAIAGQTSTSFEYIFSHIAQGDGYYSGLALLNVGKDPVSIVVQAFSREGQLIDSTKFSLDVSEPRAKLLPELLSGVSNQLGGYVRVSSGGPVVALQLFGSSDSPRFLAQVPPQSLAPVSTVPQGSTGSAAFEMSPVDVTYSVVPNGLAFTFSVFVTDLAGVPIENVCVGTSLYRDGSTLISGSSYRVCTGKEGRSSLQYTVRFAGTYQFVAAIEGLDQTVSTTVQVTASQ